MKSFAGLAGYLTSVQLDWGLTLGVTAAAVVGSVVGGRLAGRIPEATLRRGFGWFVLVMGVFVLVQQAPAAMVSRSCSRWPWSPSRPRRAGASSTRARCAGSSAPDRTTPTPSVPAPGRAASSSARRERQVLVDAVGIGVDPVQRLLPLQPLHAREQRVGGARRAATAFSAAGSAPRTRPGEHSPPPGRARRAPRGPRRWCQRAASGAAPRGRRGRRRGRGHRGGTRPGRRCWSVVPGGRPRRRTASSPRAPPVTADTRRRRDRPRPPSSGSPSPKSYGVTSSSAFPTRCSAISSAASPRSLRRRPARTPPRPATVGAGGRRRPPVPARRSPVRRSWRSGATGSRAARHPPVVAEATGSGGTAPREDGHSREARARCRPGAPGRSLAFDGAR